MQDNNKEEVNKSIENEDVVSFLQEEVPGWKEKVKKFFSELIDIREKTDKENTITHILEDIPFKGHTTWILACSIFIASIGLNANSTAVVIGAMLISPLMGPILGIGMSVAINDIVTLNRSLKNFAVMVVISVFTAFVFFYIFPLKAESSELLARTAPDFRDVLIAFFGGLALIIARTKEGTIASVIFGVAIATALMPPLCTAGFGLAIGEIKYFLGAMYLFVINTIFIAFATYIVLKILRFPMVKYANQAKRKKTTRIIYFIAVLAMVPAIYTFYNVFQKSMFERQASDFVKNVIEKTNIPENAKYIKDLTRLNYSDDEKIPSSIEVVFMGNASINERQKKTWYNHLADYSRLNNTTLNITQGVQNDSEKNKYMVELYENAKKDATSKDEIIRLLREDLDAANQGKKSIDYNNIFKRAYVSFENLKSISYAESYRDSSGVADSSIVFSVTWDSLTTPEAAEASRVRFEEWIKLPPEKFSLPIEVK